jgi:hypothetical protein
MRTLEGALSAGLFPGALAIVAALAPKNKRSRWLGFVTGGALAHAIHMVRRSFSPTRPSFSRPPQDLLLCALTIATTDPVRLQSACVGDPQLSATPSAYTV